MAMRTLIVGCGNIAASHVRILTKVRPQVEIYLCDLDRSQADALAARIGARGVFTDIEEALAEARPEVTHVTTPPASHVAVGRQALQAGSHVYLEKPIAPHLDEYSALHEMARKCGKLLGGGYSTLGMPVVMGAHKVARSGELGRFVCGTCSFAGSEGGGKILYKRPDHWAYQLPMGILQNMIDHPLSLIASFMDEIEDCQVCCLRRNVLPHDSPDLVAVTLCNRDQSGGVQVSLGHGCNERRALLLFEGGAINLDLGRQLWYVVHSKGPQNFVRKALSGIGEGKAHAFGTIGNMINAVRGRLQRDPGIANLLASFYDAAEGRGEFLVEHATVERVLRALDTIIPQAAGARP